MKNALLRMAVGSFLLWAPGSLMAAKTHVHGTVTPKEIKQDSTDLRTALTQMGKYEAKLDASRRVGETKVLGRVGRQNLANDIGMNIADFHGYLAEAEDEIGALEDHWSRLTPGEKSLVDEARLEVERDPYAGP